MEDPIVLQVLRKRLQAVGIEGETLESVLNKLVVADHNSLVQLAGSIEELAREKA